MRRARWGGAGPTALRPPRCARSWAPRRDEVGVVDADAPHAAKSDVLSHGTYPLKLLLTLEKIETLLRIGWSYSG